MAVRTDSKCRVLLVEDEALVAMMIERMLGKSGCEVAATVGRVDEAVAVAGTAHFDVALVDVNLHGVMAWPVADVLQAHGIPFAFVTGYGAVVSVSGHSDAPVLQKPFRSQDLEELLQRLRSRQRRTEG